MVDPKRIKHRELRKLVRGGRAKIDARWFRKIQRMIAQLNVAVSPEELTFYRRHELSGNRKGTHALHVSPNYRLTFKWDEEGPYDIDLEDYHGN